jgi:F-type H+-transporting ATPase subunit a
MAGVNTDIGWVFRCARAAALALALLAGALFAAAPARAAKEAHGGAHGADIEPGEGEPEKDPLDHVIDHDYIELFESFGPEKVHIPALFTYRLGGKEYQFPTKFMLLELLAAIIVAALYIPLGRRLQSGELPAGWHHNLRDVLLTFVRDDIARPAIGEHDADKYVPFLWTMFLFILVCNLLGMIPFMGSPTGNIFVTGGLAVCVFFAIHGSAAAKMGFGHYMASMWPHFDVPYGLGYILKPMIFLLEWMGVLVRNAVLAVRLFANMFAGHVVLATLLIFIFSAGTAAGIGLGLWSAVTVGSVLGQVALSLLELFVACLQAYIFTFLAALFMGMAMHPAH